jgi:serine/threonine-protein kinase
VGADPLDDTLDAFASNAAGAARAPVVDQRYELLGLLGSGGMGNVYKARDRELDEIVALKVLRPELVGASGAIERFRREVKLARRVAHPNVARVFDLDDHGGDKIITMALIDGEPLSALLARGRPSITRVIDIASQICAGVGAAHAAGVVHRDLKPDNVMVEKGGNVVVTDFGIARAAATSEAAKTFGGGVVGTPAYMAPEQVDERAQLDARADMYAFGVMLYEMLVGDMPWHGDSVIAIAAARLLHPPPDPRAARPDLPADLAAVVLKCMARSRDDRYAQMSDVAAALARVTLPIGGGMSMLPAAPAIDVLPDGGGVRRVAVLPFKILGPKEEDHVADGITEDLIDLLSASRQLRVSSRGVVMKYKDVDRDPRELGRELGVDVVVEGSVRRAPGSFRIGARLVSVADGFQLWSRRFQGAEAEMLALNDEVARAVAEALTVHLTGEKRGAVQDLDAIDLYLRARKAYQSFFLGDQEGALALFEQALEKSPDDPRIIAGWVMARARTGRAIGSAVPRPGGGGPTEEIGDRLRAQAERAVRLAPSLADAHAALGYLKFQAGEQAAAVAPLRRALLLSPNLADAHDMLGRILVECDVEEGVRHLRSALALEPTNEQAFAALVREQYLAGDREGAIAAIEGQKNPHAYYAMLARFCMWTGDKAFAKELLARPVPDSNVIVQVALVFLDLVANGSAIDTSLIDVSPAVMSPRLATFFGQLRAEVAHVKGDRARVLHELEQSSNVALFDVSWLRRCPLFDPLRGDAAFQAVTVRVEARANEIIAAYRAPLAVERG